MHLAPISDSVTCSTHQWRDSVLSYLGADDDGSDIEDKDGQLLEALIVNQPIKYNSSNKRTSFLQKNLLNEEESEFCAHCLAPKVVLNCFVCVVTSYCSKECRRADFQTHRAKCSALLSYLDELKSDEEEDKYEDSDSSSSSDDEERKRIKTRKRKSFSKNKRREKKYSSRKKLPSKMDLNPIIVIKPIEVQIKEQSMTKTPKVDIENSNQIYSLKTERKLSVEMPRVSHCFSRLSNHCQIIFNNDDDCPVMDEEFEDDYLFSNLDEEISEQVNIDASYFPSTPQVNEYNQKIFLPVLSPQKNTKPCIALDTENNGRVLSMKNYNDRNMPKSWNESPQNKDISTINNISQLTTGVSEEAKHLEGKKRLSPMANVSRNPVLKSTQSLIIEKSARPRPLRYSLVDRLSMMFSKKQKIVNDMTVPDKKFVESCHVCAKGFRKIRLGTNGKKHHCYCCGNVICNKCSKINQANDARICKHCINNPQSH